MEIKNNILKYILKNAYFINGMAYAGKSAMVKLLAQKHSGIWCGEDYHSVFMDAISEEEQPNLSYIKNITNWQEFIGRTPEEYDKWITFCGKEATDLELVRLIQLAQSGKRMFVDTNISVDVLKEISDYNHVAIMLSPKYMSVDCFFERDDEDKRFILEQIEKADDPQKAMINYRNCLSKINDDDKYKAFADSGFFTMVRTEQRTIEEALQTLEEHFKL